MTLIDKTTVRFIIVGVINTIIGTSVMFLSYNVLGMNYWISSALNYLVGSIVSYILNKNFTFQNKEKSLKVLVKFIANITICYLLAYGMAKPLVRIILADFGDTVRDNVAMCVGMCLFVAINYIGQKYIVFASKAGKEDMRS